MPPNKRPSYSFATVESRNGDPRREQLVTIIQDQTCSEDAREVALGDVFLEFPISPNSL